MGPPRSAGDHLAAAGAPHPGLWTVFVYRQLTYPPLGADRRGAPAQAAFIFRLVDRLAYR